MTFEQFLSSFNQLVEQFGKNQYSPGRVKLIYQEVANLPESSWARICQTLLGECRMAPLLPEIREHASRERERLAQMQKVEHRRDAEEFWTALNREESDFVFKNLKRRISGDMGEQDFEAFKNILKTFERSGKQ